MGAGSSCSTADRMNGRPLFSVCLQDRTSHYTGYSSKCKPLVREVSSLFVRNSDL